MFAWFKNRRNWKNQISLFLAVSTFFKKNRRQLGESEQETLTHLKKWNRHILEKKDLPAALHCQKELQRLLPKCFEAPPFWKTALHFTLIISVALVLSLILRQTLLEHQRIPSGSMRSTFLEKDHVLVSKCAYGIKSPYARQHLTSPSHYLSRGDMVTFTAEDIPGIDTKSLAFRFIPVHKRLVKRLMALGGDTVYFYGGNVWTLDANGNLHDNLHFYNRQKNDEFIPFHTPSGVVHRGTFGENKQSIFVTSHFGSYMEAITKGEQGEPLRLDPNTLTPLTKPSYTMFGISNYGNCRLLLRRQHFYSAAPSVHLQQEPYLLEISHHGSLLVASTATKDQSTPVFLQRSLLPLSEEALSRLKSNLSTSRFVLKKGRIHRFEMNQTAVDHGFDVIPPALPSTTPEGTFEFERGVLYQIRGMGKRTAVHEHPLLDIKYLPLIFNCGIDWNKEQNDLPSASPQLLKRFAYFRNGDLYCMGTLLYPSSDPTLQRFIASEEKRQIATSDYTPFLDEGLPTVEKIMEKGLKIPEDQLLVLGDNHALSGDSRFFGPIPVKNIEGRPVAKIWPPSSFSFDLEQPSQDWSARVPTIIYYTALALVLGGMWLRNRRQMKQFL